MPTTDILLPPPAEYPPTMKQNDGGQTLPTSYLSTVDTYQINTRAIELLQLYDVYTISLVMGYAKIHDVCSVHHGCKEINTEDCEGLVLSLIHI